MNKSELRKSLKELGLAASIIDQLLAKVQPTDFANLITSITDGVTGETDEELAEGYTHNAEQYLNAINFTPLDLGDDKSEVVNPAYTNIRGTITSCAHQPYVDFAYDPNRTERFMITLTRGDNDYRVVATHKVLSRALLITAPDEGKSFPSTFKSRLIGKTVLAESMEFKAGVTYTIVRNGKVTGTKRSDKDEHFLSELTFLELETAQQKKNKVLADLIKMNGGVLNADVRKLAETFTANITD